MLRMTSVGIHLYVAPGMPVGGDYEGMPWEEVGQLTDLPEYGPKVTVVEARPLSAGITEKHAGFINFGSLTLGLDLDIDETGQLIIEAAIPRGRLSFKVEFPDETKEYFHGLPASWRRNIGSSNNMVECYCDLEINSVILRKYGINNWFRFFFYPY